MPHSLIAFGKARDSAQESVYHFSRIQAHDLHGLTGGLPPPDGKIRE